MKFRPTKIKICGITNLEDAVICATAGADDLGFNFYRRSPRFVEPATAGQIERSLPRNVRRVGVFVNEPLNSLLATASTAGLNSVQLHGDETPEFISDLCAASNLEVIKAFRVSSGFSLGALLDYQAHAFLLDAYADGDYGGTGNVFDWSLAETAVERGRSIYLAGGLNQMNVKDAIVRVRPYAVDACSGLESQKGRKDPAKVREFIRRVREADDV